MNQIESQKQSINLILNLITTQETNKQEIETLKNEIQIIKDKTPSEK